LPAELGGYTLGVLVQTNYGGVLEINGAPVGKELGRYYLSNARSSPDGSCMIVVATDAPLDARNLERLASRAMLGLAKTGSPSSNGSGDYVIAFSTDAESRDPYDPETRARRRPVLHNNSISPLFQAVKEATEEAVYNSLFMAKTTTGRAGNKVEKMPVERVLEICRKYGAIREKE
jgi:D-aminopeptidase